MTITKNLWEKSFKYTVNVDSNHPTDTLSLKVTVWRVALCNCYSFGEDNLRKFDVSRTGMQHPPTSLPRAEYCSMEKHWKCLMQC